MQVGRVCFAQGPEQTLWENLINRTGPGTWPISLVTFFYFRKDLTWLRNAGG